ncbi:MAG TPA: nuclear transport factor 2 family protein, partial [Trichocoleus sp.]
MDLQETLMALEKAFWQASAEGRGDLIRSYLTEDALTVGVFGMLNRETTAAIAQDQPPFVFWRIDSDPRCLQLTSDSAVVIYQASAQRQGQAPFTALMSSTYVK